MIRRTSKILHSGILIAAISMSGMPSASFAADSAEQEPLSKTQIIHQINQLVDDRNPNSPIFVQGLGHSEKSVILASLTGLGRIGGKAVIPLVTPLLSHENEKIRQHAAFALGLSANKESAHYLWQQLETETNDLVKHEIYLSLGNLGQNGLVSRMLERLEKEPSVVAQASLFQGLGIAMVFHRDLKDDYEDIDFEDLIALFAKGDPQAARVGF